MRGKERGREGKEKKWSEGLQLVLEIKQQARKQKGIKENKPAKDRVQACGCGDGELHGTTHFHFRKQTRKRWMRGGNESGDKKKRRR
jgi:hypothetical protein